MTTSTTPTHLKLTHDALSDASVSGRKLARQYPTIWDDESELIAYVFPLAQEFAETAGQYFRSVTRFEHHRALNWALGILVIILSGVAGKVGELTFLPILTFLVFMTSLLVYLNRRMKTSEQLTVLKRDVTQKFAEEFHEAILDRRDEARAEGNGAISIPAPAPQPYGVSHRGAELLVAQWMAHLGDMGASVTQYTGDGGIDISSSRYLAQVKNYTGTVGVASIRELAGVASVDGRRALFFTSGNYASGAVEFAERAGVALFTYDAENGTLHAQDALARQAMIDGL